MGAGKGDSRWTAPGLKLAAPALLFPGVLKQLMHLHGPRSGEKVAMHSTLWGPALLAGCSCPAGSPGPHRGRFSLHMPGKFIGLPTHACAYVHSPPRPLVNSSLSLVESHCVLQTSFFPPHLCSGQGVSLLLLVKLPERKKNKVFPPPRV